MLYQSNLLVNMHIKAISFFSKNTPLQFELRMELNEGCFYIHQYQLNIHKKQHKHPVISYNITQYVPINNFCQTQICK